MTELLVSTEWLGEHMFDADLRIVDASWYLPAENRDPRAEFWQAHIPGAVFFDIDDIKQPGTHLPHMAADPSDFADAVGKLGISDTDTIVIYDGKGLFSAARAWWNFRVMGAKDVHILAGGLPRWIAEGRQLVAGVPVPPPSLFHASPQLDAIKTDADVAEAIRSGAAQIVDMRPSGRFSGAVAEPREGLRSGHMPRALNVPFSELIQNGQLKSDAHLMEVLKSHGVDPEAPLITTCGSGITATLLNLALAQLGFQALNVYDGSWAEWGSGDTHEVVTGEA